MRGFCSTPDYCDLGYGVGAVRSTGSAGLLGFLELLAHAVVSPLSLAFASAIRVIFSMIMDWRRLVRHFTPHGR